MRLRQTRPCGVRVWLAQRADPTFVRGHAGHVTLPTDTYEKYPYPDEFLHSLREAIIVRQYARVG